MLLLRFSLPAALCCLFCCTFSFAQDETLFFNQSVDSVLMVEFEWSPKPELYSVIDEHGKLPRTTQKKVVLSPSEQAGLVRALNNKKSFGEGKAACYEPRLGFVFYQNGAVAGHITICLSCNYLVSSSPIPAQQQNKQVTDNGDVFYLGEGMSERFRQQLDGLLEQYAFQYRVSD